jgi:hypothetical protein
MFLRNFDNYLTSSPSLLWTFELRIWRQYNLSECRLLFIFRYEVTVDLQEVGYGGMDWIELAQNRDRGTCECSNEPPGSKKCGEFLD